MLSTMARPFFAHSPLLVMPLVALFAFLVAFVIAALRAWKLAPEQRDELGHLPLQEEAPHGTE